MRFHFYRMFLVCAAALVALGPMTAPRALAVDTSDTLMLSQPAVSQDHVAFVYAHDLWVAQRDGSNARRLTGHVGSESSPRFSPDGRWIAFSAQYDGNTDVFLVPVEGGQPQRLTWHPGADFVQGFTPDGSAVLFTSGRTVHTGRYSQLFTVSVKGGFPEKLSIPNAAKASMSPDGSKIAYLPVGERFNQWKNYRGGTVSRIWIYDVADHSVVEVPQPPGRSNDTDPMWIGDELYFRSDRDGEFNLYRYDPAGRVERKTRHEDFPILGSSAGNDTIVYEQAGALHLFDPASGQSQRLRIGVATEMTETRPRYVSDDSYLRDFDLSPSAARVAIEYRGEIMTVPAEKGHPRNLTQSTAAHDRSPVWSPDGQQIAYVSDQGGEYALYVAPQNGRGDAKRYELEGAGFYEDLVWSPDGEKISYTDNSWSLYWLDLESGKTTKVSSEPVYGPIKTLHHHWSPDSRWLAYTRNSPSGFQTAHLYSLETGKSHALTDGLSDIAEPVFDASGKYLWLAASTDAGPVRQWFAMSNSDAELSNDLYLIVLASGEPSPLAPESDEEATDEEDSESEEAESGDDSEEKDAEDGPAPITIDFDGIDQRILAIPSGNGGYSQLTPGPDGTLFYLKTATGFGTGATPGLFKFDLEIRKETELLAGVGAFSLSADGSKVAVSQGGRITIAGTGGPIDPSSGGVDMSGVQVRIDPRAEWKQILREAWRINRDYFYDPNMHGADWPAMWEKYSAFLPHLASRSDLNRLIQWMCSEIAVGHHFVFGGDNLVNPDTVPGGLLGADYELVDGRYRFAKVFGGLNWNPSLRSPLTEPGVEIREGEYLIAVDGQEVKATDNLFRFFENTSGRTVELTVASDAAGTDSRTVTVSPIGNERALRNRDWVEGNLRRVHEATDGRVAYVYVPNTAGLGHTYFKRYFYPQAQKEAIIVDERYNGGGQIADYYIDLLRRPFISYWATRYGQDLEAPAAAIHGPKVMLIDETAGSGGDLLPWMFRKLELGKLIGKRTWGGLVGILGFPTLMDGGFVTAPNIAIWTEDGFVVENVGVPPDIDVEMLPSEVIAGRDPQLEKAIEVILEELEANPRKTPTRPPFPIRARQ